VPHYGPWAESASNRNENQEYFLRGKDGRCLEPTNSPPTCVSCLEIWEPQPPGTLWTSLGSYRDALFYRFWVLTKCKTLLYKRIISVLSDSVLNFGCCLKRFSCKGLNRPLGLKEVETSRISRRSAHESGPRHRLPLPSPQRITLILISVRIIVRPEQSRHLKFLITPSAMEPATFRLVTQRDGLRMLNTNWWDVRRLQPTPTKVQVIDLHVLGIS